MRRPTRPLPVRAGHSHSKRIFESPQLAIYDDFLPPRAFRQLGEFCNAAQYEMVHAGGIRKVWRLHDGFPLQGPTVTYFPHASSAEDEVNSYPTSTALDTLIEAIADELPKLNQIVGKAGEDWMNMSAAPWIYPAGSALSLHQDGGRYSGAYTYFVHPHWNLYWGGWLVVLDSATPAPRRQGSNDFPWLDDEHENASVWNPGIGTVILPKPNRLCFMGPAAMHLITRVDSNAGMRPRISIAGFFRKGQDVE